MNTPHLDAFRAAWSAAYEKTLDCPCRHLPTVGAGQRTRWLTRYGTLRKKRTAQGWRRAWQCNLCLGNMPGDGKNEGPPTSELLEFLTHDHPERKAVYEQRHSAWECERSQLPSRREAWFKDHDLYLQSEKWKALRGQVLQRDGFMCVRCAAAAEQVHHLTYERWQNEELNDLVSLCRECHEKEHTT